KLAEPLALAAKVETVLSQRRGGLINYQIELAQVYWEFYSRDNVQGLEVGLAEQHRPVTFSFDDAPHTLYAGTSGSGKSEAIKSTLIGLVETHEPTELGLIICDPHHDYTSFENAIHLAAPVAHDPTEIEKMLTWVNRELVRRKVNNIKDGKRLIIVIDEAEIGLSEMGLEVVRQVSREARKYRIHLFIGYKKPTHADLAGILDNLLNRFVGQVTDSALSVRLTGHSGLEAHKLTGKGDFLHIVGPEVARFQVAMATRQDFEKLERTEINPLNIEEDKIIDLPVPKTVGRPVNQVQPNALALYVHNGPQQISITKAKSLLGFSRGMHNLHKDFASKFIREMKRLRGER
ncbi:MAG: FtsK/SpoIIIE domain-containing protein, partial [Chloroflexota bacterium]